jgi:hypothetical protein
LAKHALCGLAGALLTADQVAPPSPVRSSVPPVAVVYGPPGDELPAGAAATA